MREPLIDEPDDLAVELGEVLVKRETEKALLVVTEAGDEAWIPKSQISPDSEVQCLRDSPGCLTVARWLAEEKGLI